MRIRSTLVAFASCLFAASAANAVIFNATTTTTGNRPLNALQVGDTITINIRMSNPEAVAIFGVGAGTQGWDNTVVGFVSGVMNVGPYFCTLTACTTGLSNSLSFPLDPETEAFYTAVPGDVQVIAGVGNYFPIIQAISTTGRAGNGDRDPGIDGVVNGGDAQVRLVFTALKEGETSIDIGTNANPTVGNVIALAGGAQEQAINAVLQINVPEPGAAIAGFGAIGFAVAAAGLRRRMSI